VPRSWSKRARDVPNSGPPSRRAWLALVEQRRGKPEKARAWLEKATKWLEQYPKGIPPVENDATGLHLHNWLEAQVLSREAQTLLEAKK
jgi:hypothetical protein